MPELKTIKLILTLSVLMLIRIDAQRISFKHITSEQGLTQNYISCMFQDSKGFMWFGTKEGLNRFDGYEFKVYRNDPFDQTSLSGNWIYTIYEDSQNRIWVGTDSLNLFISNTDEFKRIRLNLEGYLNDAKHKFTKINAIVEDKTGLIWVGTDNGLIRYNPQTNKSHYYYLQQDSNTKLSDNLIFSLSSDDSLLIIGTQNGMKLLKLESIRKNKFELTNISHSVSADSLPSQISILCQIRVSSNIIYSGTPAGLIKIDLKSRNSEFIPYVGFNFFPVWQKRILSIARDQNENLWLGTSGGLVIYNPLSKKFSYYFQNPKDEYSLSINSITSLFIDKGGKIFIGTAGKGINIYDQNRKNFLLYNGFVDREPYESSFSVSSVLLDSGNQLWVSSQKQLYKIDPENNQYTVVNLKYGPKGDISGIVEDKKKNIWVSSSTGLYRISAVDGSIKYYNHNSSDKNSLENNNVKYLFVDSKGFLYALNSIYLSKFDKESNSFFHFKLSLDSDINNEIIIRSIYDSQDGFLWFAWSDGLVKYNLNTNEKKIFRSEQGNDKKISNDIVLSICADPVVPKKYLWIGTQGGGLCRLNLENETFTSFSDKDGLPNNVIYGILSSDNELWLSTNRGLCRVTTDKYGTPTFRNYDVTDGLQGNEYNTGAYYKGNNGELFFGGLNGVNGFFPSEIRDNIYIPPIVFIDLTFLTRVSSNEDSVKSKISLIDNRTPITIPYSLNSFTIRFASLDYTAPEKNKYEYKLEPVQKNWIDLGTQRSVTFTELSSGEYELHVIGSNNDGIWNQEGTILKIIITPPFWQTNWAYLLYLILIVLILYGIRKYELNRISLKNRLKQESFETRKLKELDEMKSEFFANISHEFRTPLTLILGPTEQLEQAETDQIRKQKFLTIRKNAVTLLRLINQILDLSKLETGKEKLKYEKNDLVSFVKGITMSFISIAERKNISLNFKSEVNYLNTSFDKDAIERIFYNLLSNAIKFTPSAGKVEVKIIFNKNLKIINTNTDSCAISVKDTGIGISEDDLPKVFNKFFIVQKINRIAEQGSGIGLALTKELVELHNGKISVQSKFGEGSEFTVIIPIDKDFYTKAEQIESSVIQKTEKKLSVIIDNKNLKESDSEQLNIADESIQQGDDSLIILIVEDNAAVRKYISSHLVNDYKLIEASDGKEGFNKAVDFIPDLIISDVMMPEMDGLTLCKKLKADERTSHVPIILLTAKAGEADKLNGLEFGADDYLIKPFSSQELTLRIKNLIEIRLTLRKKFSESLIIRPKEIASNSIDKLFLEKAIRIVENNISSEKFTVINLSNEMNLSHSQLHRKLKALVNQSAIQFIRSIRMQRADDLLKNNAGTIAEIAYMVGFGDPSYFTKTFSKHFGYLPSDIKK